MADLATLPALSTATWDETKPAGTRDANLGDDDIREFKGQMRERLAVDHKWLADETGATNLGAHKAVHLITQATPDSVADIGIIYAKDVGGKAEAHFLDEDNNELQLTSGGKILGDNVRLSNNANLTAKNAAGTGTVNIIKANASDEPEISDGAVMASSAAPTVDAGIANKKYVDDGDAFVRVVSTTVSSLVACTTTLPHDDSIPQNTEGDEVMTLSITPKSATNKLKIEVVASIQTTGTNAGGAMALFQDDTANALAAVCATGASTGGSPATKGTAVIILNITAGTTSSTTFKVRIGPNTGTIYFNGDNSGTRLFGGVSCSSITITETKA